MVLPVLTWSDVTVLGAALLVLAAPGLLVGLAAGLRGWRLATGAPLFTFAVIGLGGPWTTAVGLRWSPLTFIATVAFFAVAVAGIRRLARVRGGVRDGATWARPAHLAVAACVVLASAIGMVGTLVGLGRLDNVLGGFDAGFHANGVRWIVDTGDASVYGMSQINWYDSAPPFYPNAYHLLCAITDGIVPGQHLPAALNAMTALTPAVYAIGMAALVVRFAGRAVLAGVASLLIVAAAPLVDLYFYGPLLPFSSGLALIPAALVFTADALTAVGRRARALQGLLLTLSASALLTVHPSILITAVLIALPMVCTVLWSRRDLVVPALVTLTSAGVATALLCVVQILGTLGAQEGPPFDWRAELSPAEALGQALLFQHGASYQNGALTPQLWLALGLALGVLFLYTLRDLRWMVIGGALFGGLYIVAASVDTPWSTAVTSPWWNDRWRLLAVASLGMILVAAHGFAELHRRARDLATTLLRGRHPARHVVSTGLAVALVVGLLLVTHGLYLGASEARVRNSVGDGPVVGTPTVSQGEEAGYAYLGGVVASDERVMNDRWDGSIWMYALDGVHPVFGHYASAGVSGDQALLESAFNRYDTDAAVRAAADRLNVRWVTVGSGTVIGDPSFRAPGLEGLDSVRSLRVAYRNADIVIYRLAPVGGGA